jgi:hypothetical protein
MLIDGRETLSTGVAGASDAIIKHDLYKLVETLKAGTTVPVTKIVSGIQTLSSGTLTIDLTALTGANGSVDATGLKLQSLFIKNLGAATLEVDVGSSNGYNLGNNAANEFHLAAGCSAMFFYADTCPDVGSGAKNIDLVGTSAQTSQWVMIFG